ncbi:hypothetical protein BKA08_003902 [Nocardioides marinisabuli]|uniref:Uncharacterized protein n=1 Tax=Nocardioides marinisabuli TaxID=419476 RepID=A0A7Y9JUA8_9ACTN|nr:hypothetical protein [Nocardioides marinisabuli]NYD59664.1 hypothetical protein [Nocardioides marinisabuli]
MKKSFKRAAAASAVCAVSLAGTLATNPTAVAGEAAEARASQKAITDFGMKALAFGTKVSVGGIDIKSLKDSLDILACTRSAGVERVKPSKLSTEQITSLIAENAPVDIAKLISISPSTSRTSTYRDGAVTGTRAVNTIADITLGGELVQDLKIPTLKIQGLNAVADSFHDPADTDGDGNPFGTDESFGFEGISLDYEGTVVEGTPLADLLDIVNQVAAPVNEIVDELVTLLLDQVGQIIEIPGLGSIGLGSSFSKVDDTSAVSGANALKIEVDPSDEGNDSAVLLKLGYAQSRISDSKPSGVFRSTIMGLDFEALPLSDDVSLLHLGGIGTESIPCEGTGNKKVVKSIEGDRAIPLNIPGLGGVAVLNGLEYSYKAKQMSRGRARSMAKSSLGSFSIPLLDLEVTGISSKLNLLSREGERVRGSKNPKFKVADILYKGESLMPAGGLKIRETVEFTIDELGGEKGFLTFGPRYSRNYYGAKLSALSLEIPAAQLKLDLGWLESQIYPR